MDELDAIIWYIFVLSLVLILVAYYVGVQTDAQSFSDAFNKLLLTATGRNSSGAFAGYPK